MSYVPLNIKTGNYLLSSMIQIPDLVKEAKNHGINTLSIADNNMYGVLDFYKACKENGIKPIIGLEININGLKLVLYARNYEGYKNLIKLSTISSERELNLDDVMKYSGNIICILPYDSKSLFNDVKKIFEYLFIGYKNDDEKNLIKSSNKVYFNEILCLEKEEEVYLKYLYAIRDGKLALEVVVDKFDVSLFPLKCTDEENNHKINELCNLEIPFHENLMPLYPCEIDSFEYLKKECIKGLKKIFGDSVNKKYKIRLKYELDVINKMGFCDYFLIVADYIKYAKDNGILVGPGRGSAAGSLVSYLLNITTIDPIKYDLLFERFLNPERISMPDIDVDFEDSRRDEVSDYCIKKYGLKKVAPIITFGTMGARQVVKDVGRVLSTDSKKLDLLSKQMDPRLSLMENAKLFQVGDLLKINEDLRMVYQIARKFEGLKRHSSIHAAGIVMSRYDLDEVIPLDHSHNDFYTTGYDMTYLEEIGLLKMDFLGLKNLTLINNILSEIDGLDFDSIPEDDPKALDIFNKANTIGVFQFESDGMINFLRKFKPTTFADIGAALALFRPGPMKNIDSYIRRKNGRERISYFHSNLEEILKPTYGIIIYQEQIMQIANVMAGYSFSEADTLRKAMSKKKEDVLTSGKDKFINQSVARGYDRDLATRVYDMILSFASYGFNKSHSVAYGVISYRMAYLKAHYPLIFMKNLLSLAINSETKTKEYMYECKLNKIDVLAPDINLSSDDYFVKDNAIIFPLTNIKGVGMSAARTILGAREEKPFADIFDFVKRCYGKAVNIKVLENLILAGAFDKFGFNKKTLIDNLEVITNYAEIGELLDDEQMKPELNIVPDFSKSEIMDYELKVYGFYLSNHPITEYKLNFPKIVPLKELGVYFDKTVEIVVFVDRVKVIDTKKKEKMMFISGSDELSKVDIVLFPKVYNRYYDVKVGDILHVTGKVEKRFDQTQVVANILKKLN
ncbi:MAG: DNA polymerase III subunit alpha [Bacilli bacterium]|nr:DNA polymerase III subunit alpha [Bacilli bacterium]